jgi:hypothetical protein
MLDAPLEKWRVFLHPSQRKIIERDCPVTAMGCTRSTGGAYSCRVLVSPDAGVPAKTLAVDRDYPLNIVGHWSVARYLKQFRERCRSDVCEVLRRLCVLSE